MASAVLMPMDTLSPTRIGNPIAGIIVFVWNGFWCPTAPSSRNQTAPGAVRPSPAHQYFQPRGGCRLCLFPWHRRPGSHVPYKSLVEIRAIYMSDVARSVSGPGPGEVNCHFRQLTIAGNFRTQPAAPAFENCWHATNSAPREHKTFDSLNFLCV